MIRSSFRENFISGFLLRRDHSTADQSLGAGAGTTVTSESQFCLRIFL